MQIELIDTFLDLMETNSFNGTAERLGVKQSTISTRIQSLESLLGAQLFERSRAGTRPTAAGLSFLTHARSLRHEWNEARRTLSSGNEAGPHLRLGLQSDLATRSYRRLGAGLSGGHSRRHLLCRGGFLGADVG